MYILRGVVAESEDNIKASADSLGKHGFINYFGLQVLLDSPSSWFDLSILITDE